MDNTSSHLPSSPNHEKFIDDLATRIYRCNMFTSLKGVIREDLLSYSPELLKDLAELFKNENEVTSHVKVSISMKHDEGLIREFMLFTPFLPFLSFSYVQDIIASLHTYPQLPDAKSFYGLDDKVIKKCSALLHVAANTNNYELYRNGVDMSSGFKDSKLVDLIISRPEQSDRIIEIINERGTGDPEVILLVLDFQTGSLSSGAI